MEQNSTLGKIRANFTKNAYDVIRNHYADFKGRASRSNFWFFQLYMFLLVFISSMIFEILNMGNLSLLITLALFLPTLSMSVRRLHDTGKRWYWLLLSIVPGLLSGILLTTSPSLSLVFQYLQIAGNIWLLVLFCQKGENKENAWGIAQ